MPDISRFSFPTQIRFGPGARSTLAEFAEVHRARRPLVVTDPGLLDTDAYRLVKTEATRVWPDAVVEFTRVTPNPSLADVEATWRSFADSGCDAVVGVGGGSVLDVAKIIRVKAEFPSLPLPEIPFAELPPKLRPLCAVPTTAGTGSEVGRSSVITLPATGRKAVFGGPPLMADMAILDPELTVGLPPALTAATGMDALTHAVEAFVCPMFHPMCDAIALEAVRLVRAFLPRAYGDGSDLEARGMMQLAAAMGAVSFQKDLGAAHSLAHPLSTRHGIQHGLANALVLPSVVRFNGEHAPCLYDRVADALGLQSTGGSGGSAPAVAGFIERLSRSLGIPDSLRKLGIRRDDLPALAADAVEDGCHLTNPRPCREQDLLALYESAW